MGTSSSDDTRDVIIWIDPNIDNKENKYYFKQLKRIENKRISKSINILGALKYIKKLTKFPETNIIISDSLYNEFIENLKEILNDIFIIPIIIIYTSNKEIFLKNNKNCVKNSFYTYIISTSFNEIIDFLSRPILRPINKKNVNEENKSTFEYIDSKEKLVLPLLYQYLIEMTSADNIQKYTEYLFNKYQSNLEINKLLNSIRNISNIPLELLSKIYARLYTIESTFYKDINEDLKDNQKEKYLSYIKLLYEGVKLKSLPLTKEKILYRGSKISKTEKNKINEFLKKKKRKVKKFTWGYSIF